MGVIVGVASAPQPQERRVALVPDLVKKYEALGAKVVMASGAAKRAHWADEAFAGVEILSEPEEVFRRAQLVLCVQPPRDEELALMPEGSILVGALQPWASRERVEQLLERRITSFALELLPRISRAQSMDILSSQATVAGYEAALIAADHSPKFFPMLTYAAGTIRPAKVLVIGAGVAGLQAIATARRLGAAVEAYDVRPETREQVESLGAKFLDTGVRAVGEGGYARELTEEEKALQAEKLGKAVGQADALITTASIPGRPAPRIITAGMIAHASRRRGGGSGRGDGRQRRGHGAGREDLDRGSAGDWSDFRAEPHAGARFRDVRQERVQFRLALFARGGVVAVVGRRGARRHLHDARRRAQE